MIHPGLLEENPPRIGSTTVFYFHSNFPARGDSDLSLVGATFTGQVFSHSQFKASKDIYVTL